MFRQLHPRLAHYGLLTAAAGAVFLVNLGGPSLWDIDEGNNAEAAREMMEAGNWIEPTFNFQLRADKPALLYWLQIGAYQLFGINEFSARLPSALAALATVLLLYEFGRLIFGALAGLLSGLILASTPGFSAAAHFANPDALLNAFTTLSLFFFWRSYVRSGRGWFIWSAISAALGFLAKGPVGLVLPLGVVALFLLWSRQLRLFWDRRLALAILAFTVVAVPWYALVGAETKGEFLRGFFLSHNVDRYLHTMENHRGSFFYYPVVLILGFAPWSAFLGLAAWYGARPALASCGPREDRAAFRFLWCWIGIYLIFFTASSTKLPNYILPVYPPLALLTAHFLDGWRASIFMPPAWVLRMTLICLGLLGVGASLGFLVAGDVIALEGLHVRSFPGLGWGAVLGLVLVLAAAMAWHYFTRQARNKVVGAVAAAAVLFVGCLGAWLGAVLNPYKAPQELATKVRRHLNARDFRVGCYAYFQPSLVFYSLHEIENLAEMQDALDFLASPLPVYLYLPGPVWDSWQMQGAPRYHVLGRSQDLYKNYEVVVVTNH
jgi:4-amino-4-deoxy-L-arabinose transferase-like glycosyltransferase